MVHMWLLQETKKLVFKETNKDIDESWTKRKSLGQSINLFMYNFIVVKINCKCIIFLKLNKGFS